MVSAMISSFLNRPVDKNLVVFGEVGLAGEIRAVSQPEVRIKEAKKLGFSRCLLPKGNLETCSRIGDVELVPVDSVQQLMEVLF
jgi:DNA repair protein RadA/Sms